MKENITAQEKPKAKRKKPTPKVSLPTITIDESNVCMEMCEVTVQDRTKKSSEKNIPTPYKPQAFNLLDVYFNIKQQIKLLKLKFKNCISF